MTLRTVLLLVALGFGTSAIAKNEQADAALAAAAQLEEATVALQAAMSPRDRVRALTEIVRSFEVGLEAMRDGLRRAATREAQVSRQLEAREDEIAESTQDHDLVDASSELIGTESSGSAVVAESESASGNDDDETWANRVDQLLANAAGLGESI